MSPHWKVCPTAQLDCHKPPATRHPPRTRVLTAFFPPPLPSPAPLLPGALLSIFPRGPDLLSCFSHLLRPLPFGPFPWWACFVVPSPAGPQPCQTCLLWALRALLLLGAWSKSVLPAQPGGHSTPGAAQNHLAGTQGSPGLRALEGAHTHSPRAQGYWLLLEKGQGEPSQCFVERQVLDRLSRLLTPFLAPLGILGLGWLLGHLWVCSAPPRSASVSVPPRSDSFWYFGFPETRDWPCWLANPELRSPARPILFPNTHLLALQLLLAFLRLPPVETRHMAGSTPTHALHISCSVARGPCSQGATRPQGSQRSVRARTRLQDTSLPTRPCSPNPAISSERQPLELHPRCPAEVYGQAWATLSSMETLDVSLPAPPGKACLTSWGKATAVITAASLGTRLSLLLPLLLASPGTSLTCRQAAVRQEAAAPRPGA